jgi:hypothetical protein
MIFARSAFEETSRHGMRPANERPLYWLHMHLASQKKGAP